MNRVKEFYDKDSDYEWNRHKRHPIEFAMTKRVIKEWIQILYHSIGKNGESKSLKICDIGGGPGHYALFLAKLGYSVSLLDISDTLVTRAEKEAKIAKVNLESIRQGTALDLSAFPDESFNIALLMGPMYHLNNKEDRIKAVTEMHRILKPKGISFTAFIGRYASIRNLLKLAPEKLISSPRLLSQEINILRNGEYQIEDPAKDGFTDAYFTHANEVSPLLENNGFRTLDTIACESFGSELEDKFVNLPEESREKWYDILYKYCRESAFIETSNHILHIGMKI